MTIGKIRNIIQHSDNIVFFGGAGVSTESGIPDFRSSGGLYNEKDKTLYPPETILSNSFFNKHTKEFYQFYRSKMIYPKAHPNSTHISLAHLEKVGKLKAIITQNIDGLHQNAGSRNVLELHGSVHRNYCMKCGKFFNLQYIVEYKRTIPKCDLCGSKIKPDVVLYEESLEMEILKKSIEYIQNSEVLIVGGTSLVVYPAASLIRYYKGSKLILINKSSTPYDDLAHISTNESISDVLQDVY